MQNFRDVITEYLSSKGVEFKEAGSNQFHIKTCINCGDEKWHFYMNQDEGLWDCKKCTAKGNFNGYRKAFGDLDIDIAAFAIGLDTTAERPQKEYKELDGKIALDNAARLWALKPRFVEYLTNERKLKEEILKRFKIGATDTHITIPIFKDNKLVNIRYRRSPDVTEGDKYMAEKGCRSEIFNGDILKKVQQVYITEGEFDAMQLIQRGFENVVSITLGAVSFPKHWIEQFENVKEVVLVYDNDKAGVDGMHSVAEKLGKEKCVMVKLPAEQDQKKTDLSDYFVRMGKERDDFLLLVEDARRQAPSVANEVKHITEFTENLRDRLLKGEHVGISSGYANLDNEMGGLREGRMIILSGLTNCIAADSEIVNPISGAICTMEEFVKSKKKYVFSWEYDTIKRSRVINWIDSGKKEVFLVSTNFGTESKATAEHPFLTPDLQWRPLRDLKVGDKIGIPRYYKVWGCSQKKMDSYKVRTLAYLIAEGGCTRSSFTFTNFDKDLQKDFIKNAELFDNIRIRKFLDGQYRVASRKVQRDTANKDCRNSIHKFWLSKGLVVGDSRTKFVPKCIFTLEPKLIAEFLSVLFSCDGHVARNKEGFDLSYSSASKKLIKQVRHLLLRFGIESRVREKKTNFDTIAYELHVTNSQGLQNYKDQIGFTCSRKQKTLDAIVVPRKNTRYETSALRFVEITKISSLGKRQVYDLTVEGTHNFIADDVLVHNCGKSSLATNICLNLAERDVPSFYFSLEMPPIDIVKKILMLKSRLTGSQLTGIADPSQTLKQVDGTFTQFKELPIYLYAGSGVVKFDILERTVKYAIEKHKARVVFVDHLHYFAQNYNNLASETSKAVREIKMMAMKYNITVVLLTHLNRGGRTKQRTGLYTPSLADLKDTGTIEQDADQVLFVCRDSENAQKDEREKSWVKIAKNRDGKAGGQVSMAFSEELTTFVELAQDINYEAQSQQKAETANAIKNEVLQQEDILF